jgi:hypothetical protein
MKLGLKKSGGLHPVQIQHHRYIKSGKAYDGLVMLSISEAHGEFAVVVFKTSFVTQTVGSLLLTCKM